MASSFETNPISLKKLLEQCKEGTLQLPDFQRSWVWDEERIKSLTASISRDFPVGALMSLKTGGQVNFKPRPIEGTPEAARKKTPEALLLDGQQRMTSLYQVTLRDQVVSTVTVKKKKVQRWFYIDIRKALDPSIDREEAIVTVPKDKVVRSNFNRKVDLDLSSQEAEFKALMYPLTKVFSWNDWQAAFINYANANGTFQQLWPLIQDFHKEVIQNFEQYQVPVISLGKQTSKEAVCLVFEKVNTGGKPLDAFELVTAMYAADGYELRKDWYGDGKQNGGRHARLLEASRPANAEKGILADVGNTDFLHVISLLHTRELRRSAEVEGKQGRDLPQVTGKREALLNLPLAAYKKYQDQAEEGFQAAAKFLYRLHIYRVFDLPYQSQIIALAAILADIGKERQHDTIRTKLVRWYWNGVFGELYGSAAETRISRDFMEVPGWLRGGPEPTTVSESSFRPDRLKTMRMRLSAAYKGVNALLMEAGAVDFRSGQHFAHTVFFDENVDIHHIFPKAWCNKNSIHSDVYDSIINKTPLSYRTNRILGGDAPSSYLARLEKGTEDTPAVDPGKLDGFLQSHLVNPALLRADGFDAFMKDRQAKLLSMIETAMGKKSEAGSADEGDENEMDDDQTEAALTLTVAE